MDAKKKQEDRDDLFEPKREDRMEASEFDIPDEMESWALDDLSDLVPTTFD